MLGLKIPFGVDSTAYRAGLSTMRNQTKRWGGQVSGMLSGVLSAGAIVGITKSVSNWGSAISDMALRTKTSVKEWMVFRDAARDAGVEVSSLERAFRNVNIRSQEALDGNKSYSDALRRLGIDVEAFVKLPTAEKFIEVARAVTFAKNQSEAYADMSDILGMRAGPQLIEVLNKVATEGYDNLAKSAVTMDDETAQALDSSADSIAKFSDQVNLSLGKVISAFVMVGKARDNLVEKKVQAFNWNESAITRLKYYEGYEFTKEEEATMLSTKVDSETERKKREVLAKKGLTFGEFSAAAMRGPSREMKEYRDRKKAQDEEREATIKRQEEMSRALAIEGAREELAKAEAKSKEKLITLEEKINSLISERERLQAVANEDTVEGLRAKKELVEVETELTVNQKKRDEQVQKDLEKQEKKRSEIAELESALSEVTRQNKFSMMSEAEQVENMGQRRDEMLKDARKLEESGDKKGAINKRIEAEELMGEMLSMQKAIDADRLNKEGSLQPRLTVSSLQSVAGGGGGVFRSAIDPELAEAKEQTALLRMLVANTGVSAETLQHKEPVS